MALVLALNAILDDKRIYNGVVRLSVRRNFVFRSLTFQKFSTFFGNCQYCAPDNLFKAVLCVYCFHKRCLLQSPANNSAMPAVGANEQDTKDRYN
jgi:hypothetical protein